MSDAAARTVAEPVPAATVVVVRDRPDGLEVLMLRRASTGAFGGMWVFPGGRVDPGDDDPDQPGEPMAAARRAAVREAREEASLVLDHDRLVPFSFWVPPPGAPRRFATWFFLAAAPAVGEIVVDGGEIHEHEWLRPVDAMARRDGGLIELAPPTWVTLHWLTAVGDVTDALTLAAAATPESFETRIGRRGDDLVALWHGDAGYGSGDATVPGPRHRLVMSAERWQYERTTGPQT